MQGRPELAGRFLHYICGVIQRRIDQKDRTEDQDERLALDLINEPLYRDLIDCKIMPPSSLDALLTLKGPLDDEKEEFQRFQNSAKPFGAACTISTYPHIKQGDVLIREGSPICDQYSVRIFPTRIVGVIADGCNWGPPPRDAARAASSAFVRYLANHQGEIKDVQHAGRLILRALSVAHSEIINSSDANSHLIGTTTILGGIVVELNLAEDSHESLPDYGFIFGSVGDCKAFHWCAQTGQISDITQSNRSGSLSASDCGGRLGPILPNNRPDLRNLALGFYPLNSGDLIFLLSDGVHDNLDPSQLGFTPADLGISANSWDTITDLVESETIKNAYRCKLLELIIYGELTKSPEVLPPLDAPKFRPPPEPVNIVSNILQYCINTNHNAVSWMENNPNQRLPRDYKMYPGKMDHTTCVCLRVGEISSAAGSVN